MSKRKIQLNLCQTIDAFIEGSKGEIDWCFTDQDYSMTEFLNGIDTIFFGRKSYEQLKSSLPDAFNDKKHVVFSRTLESDDANVRVIKDNTKEEVEKILAQDGSNIWLFGGAVLTSHLLKLKLVDELILSIHPLILGSGKPLFTGLEERIGLKLEDTKTFDTGLVQLYYSVEK
jgi:dihydrofolate reductase